MYNQTMLVVRERQIPNNFVLRLIQGDITQSQVEAIVNAANAALQHGGGVAGAISRAGGPSIQIESDEWVRQYGPISHDAPAITSAGDLPSHYIIHAVGPVWGSGDEDRKLATTVRSALRLAIDKDLSSLSLPAISTGIYGFPVDRAAEVMLDTLVKFMEEQGETLLQQIDITIIDEPTLSVFVTAFDQRWDRPS